MKSWQIIAQKWHVTDLVLMMHNWFIINCRTNIFWLLICMWEIGPCWWTTDGFTLKFFQVFSDVTRLITHFWSQNSLRICNTSILMSGFHGSHANPLSMHSGPSSYLNALDKWMKNRVKKTYNLNKKSSFKSWSFFLVHLLYILYYSWTCFVLLLNVFFLINCLLWNEYKFNQRIHRL